MQCKRRRVSSAVILDCQGIGNRLSVMPLRKAIEDAVLGGDRHFVLNFALVGSMEREFVLGVNSARTVLDRAGGRMAITGLTSNTKPFVERYGERLTICASEEQALQAVLPAGAMGNEDTFHVVVLGTDKYQDTAFAGIHHYKSEGVFHYYTNPLADLKVIEGLKPLIVFCNANVSPKDRQYVRERLAAANKGPIPTFFFLFGLPAQEYQIKEAVKREGFDDGLTLPFRGDVSLFNLDITAFRAQMGAKIEAVLDGQYVEQRKQRRR